MKVQITNFKAITNTQEFDLDNINLISGQNSGGKSSLIHALLFLKQNIEDRHELESLKFNKPLLSLGRFEDITSKHLNDGLLSFSFILSKQDFESGGRNYRPPRARNIINNIEKAIYTVEFEAKRQKIGTRVYIRKIKLETMSADGKNEYISFTRSRGSNYSIEISDNFSSYYVIGGDFSLHGKSLKSKINVGDILLDRFNLSDHKDNSIRYMVRLPVIDDVTQIIFNKFRSIHYIGPLRESPKNYYYFEDSGSSLVGTRGEFTPQYLAKNQKNKTEYYKYGSNKLSTSTILESTRYWLCDFFQLASDLSLEKDRNGVLYQIKLTLPNSKSKVSINNVGFGISQVLPIIVQSMALGKDSILILEQPEIHLHPTVQAKLFDFLSALHKKGVSTIVETHSDHLITRMRRRVAESSDGLEKCINLVFVEYSKNENSTKYSKMSLDELGNFNLWPEGFFDQYDQDVRAILKAQISKKKDIRARSKKPEQD